MKELQDHFLEQLADYMFANDRHGVAYFDVDVAHVFAAGLTREEFQQRIFTQGSSRGYKVSMMTDIRTGRIRLYWQTKGAA